VCWEAGSKVPGAEYSSLEGACGVPTATVLRVCFRNQWYSGSIDIGAVTDSNKWSGRREGNACIISPHLCGVSDVTVALFHSASKRREQV
jgi:hypothetical protein